MDNRDYRNYSEEKNRKFKGMFYVVISVVTLIVTVIGASFSYFIATASSTEGAITAQSSAYSLDFAQDSDNLFNTDLIPVQSNWALYSAVMYEYRPDLLEEYQETADKKVLAKTKCRDDDGDSVCSTYSFTVTNPVDLNATQTLQFKIEAQVNDFGNLYLTVIDRMKVVEGEPVTREDAGVVVWDYWLNKDQNANYVDGYFTFPDWNVTLDAGFAASYELILYIKNLDADQTLEDSNKVFAGSIIISPIGTDGNEIKGVIGVSSDVFSE